MYRLYRVCNTSVVTSHRGHQASRIDTMMRRWSASLPSSIQQQREDLKRNIKALLRREGPMPLSRVGSLLDDDAMESIGNHHGGLTALCSSSTEDFYVVPLERGMKVLLAADAFKFVDATDRKLILLIVALLSAAQHVPNASPISTTPSLNDLLRQIVRLQPAVIPHKITLEMFSAHLAKYPSILCLFSGRVRLTTDSISISSGPSAVGSSSSFASSAPVGRALTAPQGSTVANPRVDRFMGVVNATLPSTFYVPLSYFVNQRQVGTVLEANCSVDTCVEALTALPVGFVDVRRFGSSLDTIYVRVLQPTISDYPRRSPAEVDAAEHSIFILAEKVSMELDAYQTAASTTSTNRLRLLKGMSMQQVADVLSPSTLSDAAKHFRVAECEADDYFPRVLILLFDRLRHLYDVDLSTGVVRPWRVMLPEDQPSSLTAETTPIPLVLHTLRRMLEEGPLGPEHLWEQLPSLERSHLVAIYDSSTWCQATEPELAAIPLSKAVGCLKTFISQHSLFFTVKDGMVHLPQTLAAAKKDLHGINNNRGTNKAAARLPRTESEVAEALYNLLPADQLVEWRHFLATPQVRALRLPKSISLDFVKKHPHCFHIYNTFMSHQLVVGRAGGPLPDPDLLPPSLLTMEALVKMIALIAVGGTSEGTILNSLPPEGRQFIKRMGSATALAEQLPMWFDVKRDKYTMNASLITYIGTPLLTAADEDAYWQTCRPLRTVRNDASLGLAPTTATTTSDDSEWHPDWDE